MEKSILKKKESVTIILKTIWFTWLSMKNHLYFWYYAHIYITIHEIWLQ